MLFLIIVVGRIHNNGSTESHIYNESFSTNRNVLSQKFPKEANSEDIDKSFSEDQLGHEDDLSDQEVHSYKQDTVQPCFLY